MAKYICSNNHIFEKTVMMPNECPECHSTEIRPAKSPIPWKWIGIGLGVVIALLIIILIPKEKQAVLSLRSVGGDVQIEVKGIKASALQKNYRIEVLDANRDKYMDLLFTGQTYALFSQNKMKSNECYTFVFKYKKPSEKKKPDHKWIGAQEYCVELKPVVQEAVVAEDVLPTIHSVTPQRDCEAKEYSLTVKTNQPSDMKWTYVLMAEGQILQESNENGFHNVKPGSYTIKVYNSLSQEAEFVYVAKPFKSGEKLSKERVQVILNQVAAGTLSAAAANDMLADGSNLKLENTVAGLSTLFQILTESEGFETQFEVVTCTFDPCTNKLKTLGVKER